MLYTCQQCQTVFKPKTTKPDRKYKFCSPQCHGLSLCVSSEFNCLQCNKIVSRTPSQISKTNRIFCSTSCAATYNNTHKTKGYRRSKLELWLQDELQSLYPHLIIYFNDKTAINSELDIYFPELKLAFELNGIFHYEPIYGPGKLEQIQNNDQNKFQKCFQQQISLCIIDTTTQKKILQRI